MQRKINFVALAFVASALVAMPVAASTLYGTDDNGDTIQITSPVNGAAQLVGPSGQDLSFTGGAYDSSTGTLYVSDVADPVGGGAFDFGLGTINPGTGAVTFIGLHNSNNIWGLAYDSTNDVLYGADGDNNALVTVNRATGGTTIVGAFSAAAPTPIAGLGYDPVADVLYGIDQTSLYSINRTTGAVTLIGPLGVTLGGGDVGIALDYDDETATLYAADRPNQNLYRVDTTTGAASLIGAMGVGIDGLASVPTFSTIPTLGGTGLLALCAALALIGVVAVRRLL